MTKPKTPKVSKPTAKEAIPQIERFKAMTEEVGADEAPDALDRAFGRIKPKKPAKSK